MNGNRPGQRQVQTLVRALDRAHAAQWEIYYEEGQELSIEVEEGEIDAYEASAGSGASVRVFHEGRIGFAYTSDFSEEAAQFVVAAARAAASVCDPDPLLTLLSPEEAKDYPAVAIVDSRLAAISQDEKLDRVRAMEAAARAGGARIERVRKSSFAQGHGIARLLTSRGLDEVDESTFVRCDLLAVARDGDEERLGWEAQAGHFFSEIDFEACGRTAGHRALELLGAAPVPTGRYSAVLEPHVVCEILEVLSEALLGESVWKGRSLLSGREGKQVISPALTLVDDGTHPRGAATSRLDGEGVGRRRTVLIEQGVLRAFLYDRYWGAKAGRPSTGNSDRGGFRSPPSLGISNLVLEPGRGGDTMALCREMGEGLVIGELIGVHTADPITGDFSVGASGLRVRGGIPAEAVANIAIAGNLIGLLAATEGVGSDLKFYGSVGSPSLLVTGLDVAGR